MRVNSSNLNNIFDQESRKTTTNTAQQQQDFFQAPAPVTGTNIRSSMKLAESGIGSSILANQLRGSSPADLVKSVLGNTDALSFQDIIDFILSLFGRKKPNPNPPPAPSNPTNLQIQGDANFRQRTAQDLATFAPGTTVDAA